MLGTRTPSSFAPGGGLEYTKRTQQEKEKKNGIRPMRREKTGREGRSERKGDYSCPSGLEHSTSFGLGKKLGRTEFECKKQKRGKTSLLEGPRRKDSLWSVISRVGQTDNQRVKFRLIHHSRPSQNGRGSRTSTPRTGIEYKEEKKQSETPSAKPKKCGKRWGTPLEQKRRTGKTLCGMDS